MFEGPRWVYETERRARGNASRCWWWLCMQECDFAGCCLPRDQFEEL